MLISTKSPSRQSHSDYYSVASSCSSSCSDDDVIPFFEQDLRPLVDASSTESDDLSSLPVGVCPHCLQIFEQPISLQCGHSLCLICCNQLLFSSPPALTSHLNRPIPRMGISQRVPSTLPGSNGIVMYRTPRCPVCSAPPSRSPPVPNLALDHLLRNMRTFRWNQIEKDVSSRGSRKWDDGPIQDCRIAVLGSSKVGKTCFTMVQNGNEVMFPDVHSENEDADAYMVEIADGMSIERSCVASNGIIIMYSVVDRQSFYHAAEIFKRLEHSREHNQPIVLVGSKKDMRVKRVVTSFEGQQLARTLGIPFLEVSSKQNDCVFEAFEELVSLIQKQNAAFKNVVKQSLV
ncbi:RING-type domain-containing protein [Caenorhabditis elegans]|uniref:RING-type domain-containing protein n=2 Tax=Caenorhabditis elegans TaxID=6239 RepID=U4PQV1_CAEEL|nr:RING-type domain-containing protein [Caenorhabditis elegans]CDH92973.1 RING-type domain-containing protein [Caenorhabditis elegans]|eukprot:NP_001294278.1 Uncharacterized protein CELE_T26C12.3 [Caenorhabditis elegans]